MNCEFARKKSKDQSEKVQKKIIKFCEAEIYSFHFHILVTHQFERCSLWCYSDPLRGEPLPQGWLLLSRGRHNKNNTCLMYWNASQHNSTAINTLLVSPLNQFFWGTVSEKIDSALRSFLMEALDWMALYCTGVAFILLCILSIFDTKLHFGTNFWSSISSQLISSYNIVVSAPFQLKSDFAVRNKTVFLLLLRINVKLQTEFNRTNREKQVHTVSDLSLRGRFYSGINTQ